MEEVKTLQTSPTKEMRPAIYAICRQCLSSKELSQEEKWSAEQQSTSAKCSPHTQSLSALIWSPGFQQNIECSFFIFFFALSKKMTILTSELSKINGKQQEMKNKNVQTFSRFRVTSPIHLLNPGSIIPITDFAALKQWHCTCRLFLLFWPLSLLQNIRSHWENSVALIKADIAIQWWCTARKGAYAFASLE